MHILKDKEERKNSNINFIVKERNGEKRKITIMGFIKITYHKKAVPKKKICISGNCVSATLTPFLMANKDFRKRFDVTLSKPVFMVEDSDVETIKAQVAECDIFITQPIVGGKFRNLGIDTESLKQVMKKDSKVIVMPVPYFSGYFPEQFYLHDSNGNLIGECEGLPHPYHNKIILYGYINKISASRVLEIINSENNMSGIRETVENSIAELKRRSISTDFQVHDFIQKNYKKHRLFFTINHPTNYLIKYICEEILKLLGIKKHFFKRSLIKYKGKESLDFIVTPIIKSVSKELELSADCLAGNPEYTLDYITACYTYYDKHPALVELNKDVVKDLINLKG